MEKGKNYDRLGVDKEYIDILNIPIRKLTVPIRQVEI